MGGHRQTHRLDQLTVDAVPDPNLFVERFDVDVGGAVAKCLADDPRHQLDDRRLIVEADLVERLFAGLVGGLGIRERGDQPTDVGVRTPQLLHVGGDRLGVGRQPLVLLARRCLGGVTLGLRAIGTPDDDLAALLGDRDEVVLAGDLLFEVFGEFDVDLGRLGVADRQPARLAQRCRVLGTADAVLGEHDVAEVPEITLAIGQRLGQRFAGEMPGLDQRLTERDTFLDALAGTLFGRDATTGRCGCPFFFFLLTQRHLASPYQLL